MHPSVVTPFIAIARVTGAAMAGCVLAAAILYAIDSDARHGALAVALAMLGVRIGVLAWGAARREWAWTRLVLPGIVLVEGAGLLGVATGPWQVRLGVVVA